MERLIIAGGGIMGASVALFLKTLGFKGEVVCYERDTTFAKSSTTLSAASIRQQFSIAENIRLSQFALKCFDEWNLDISFKRNGYLYLATKTGEAVLEDNYAVQLKENAPILKLNQAELKAKFPYLVTDDITLATWGQQGEGWFDAARLLDEVRARAKLAGAILLKGEITKINTLGDNITSVEVNDETVACTHFIATTGALTGRFLAKIGIKMPVEPRKRTVFVVKPKVPMPSLPLVIDPSGLWVRSDNDLILLGGGETTKDEAPAYDDFEPDYPLFDDKLWELLAARIPVLEELKFIRAWAGHYDYNTLDQNAIIGGVTPFKNLYTLTGFSGHGLQQGLGAGRGLAELIIFGAYQTLDLSCFGFERVLKNEPFFEKNII